MQWTQKAVIKERFVLMSEPDHVFLLPLQNPMRGDHPAAFPFFYIEPSKKEFLPVTRKFVGASKTRHDCEQIAPIGSSPTFLTWDQLKLVAPHWVNTSIAIFEDPVSNKAREGYSWRVGAHIRHFCCARCQAKPRTVPARSPLHSRKRLHRTRSSNSPLHSDPIPLNHSPPTSDQEWGWVMEMYAFTISLYNDAIGPVALHLELAAQPPWDTTMGLNGSPYAILHYTYGMDYTLEGTFTPGKIGAWRFDKRSHAGRPPPRHLGAPPAGMKNDLVRFLIRAINEASDAIPGWDEYSATGVAQKLMKYDD